MNANGCDGTSDVFVFTGIEELNSWSVGCSPNPFVDAISIQSTHKILSVDVYDMAGHLLLSSKDTNLNLEALAKGFYVMRCKSELGSAFLRVEKL